MSGRLKKAKSKLGTKRVSRLEQLRLARINRGNGDTELPTAGSRGDASDAPAASASAAIAPAAGPTPAPSSTSGSAGGELGQGNSETALDVSICPSFYATLLFIRLRYLYSCGENVLGTIFVNFNLKHDLDCGISSLLFIYVTIFRRMLLRCLVPPPSGFIQ